MKTLRHLLICISALLAIPVSQASGGEVFTAYNAKWKSECGSCHVAYPARLLPATSWKTIMGGLDKHFGTDATLDNVSVAEIQAFLEKNASRRKPEPGDNLLLRITETHWFQNEHNEVPARAWKNPQVKGPANCSACHTKAESGDFNEHNIHIPR